MTTEWLRIMLEEIERKRQAAQEARDEEARRAVEKPGNAPPESVPQQRASGRQ